MKLIKLIMSRMTLVLALILLLWSVAFYLNLSNRLYYIVDTGLRAFASDRISEFLVSPGKDSAVQLDTAGIYTYSIASVPETYALANYGVSIRNQSEQSAGVERAQQRIFRFVQPFCRLHGRRLFISRNVETNVFRSEMHGGLDGRDAVVESVSENESLIALLQRVLHLRQH